MPDGFEPGDDRAIGGDADLMDERCFRRNESVDLDHDAVPLAGRFQVERRRVGL